jgi:endoglucanase
MKGLNDAGMYVLLDHHRPDCNAISELWTTPSYSEKNWIDDLVFVAKRYQSLPRFIGIDLKNEPHGAATWGFGNAATDWNRAAERAAAQVLAANGELLVFVEGVQENPVCSSRTNHWWGGNLEPIACAPLQIPARNLVLSPHVYGPDVYDQPYFAATNFPANMPALWDQQFGSLIGAGYTVVIGEFGGRFGHGGSAKDKVWQDALVDYLIAKGANSAFYWSWNPNSGDTGGVLQDDWQTPWPDKVALLGRLWGSSAGAVPPSGGSAGTVSPPASPTPTPALTTRVAVNNDYGSGYCADVFVHNGSAAAQRWQVAFTAEGRVLQLWNASGSQSGSTVSAEGLDWNRLVAAGGDVSFGFCAERAASAAPSPMSGTSPASTPAIVARVTVNSDWGAGYCAGVQVGNEGGNEAAWRVSVPIAGTVTQAWNAQWSQSANTLSAQGLDWNRLVPARGTTSFGFCASR